MQRQQNVMVRSARMNLGMALCLSLLVGTTGTAAASSISLDTDFWNPSVTKDSDVKTMGGTINLKDDLGVNKKNLMDLTIRFKSEPEDAKSLFLQHDGTTFKADKALSRSMGIYGAAYAAGDRVNSEVKYDHFQFGMKNESVTDSGTFSTIYSWNNVSLDTKFYDQRTAMTSSKKRSFNSLGIGFGWESKGTTQFVAEITPLSIAGGGMYNAYKVGIKAKIGGSTSVAVGYKGERLQAGKDKDTDRTRLDLKGMYWGLESSF